MLSRVEAQTQLRQANGDQVAAALVLLYESVGAHRANKDCSCEPGDLAVLESIRCEIGLSVRRAIAVLATRTLPDIRL